MSDLTAGVHATASETSKTAKGIKNSVLAPRNQCGRLLNEEGETQITPLGPCYMFTGVLVLCVVAMFTKDLLAYVRSTQSGKLLVLHTAVGVLAVATMVIHCQRCNGIRGVVLVMILYFIGWVGSVLLCGHDEACIKRMTKK